MRRLGSIRFRWWLIISCLFVAAAGYLSTGTMAPYAAIHPQPLILKPCNYLLNPDNPHFIASFKMLEGAPRAQWDFSVVLRRTLFPILAFPLMKLWGFLVGGVITSLMLQIAAVAGFAIYVRRRIGKVAGLIILALLASYPGIYFWCGLPYCYAIIVPAALMATICSREIDAADSFGPACACAIVLGILFTGYDLFVFFAPAVVVMLLLRRRWGRLAPVIILMVLPEVINKYLLIHVAGVNFNNENSQQYVTLISAYLHPGTLGAYLRHIEPIFESLFKVFFFSNFTFLPALFLLFVLVAVSRRGLVKMELLERWILLSALALFLFINLAPPHAGWQFSGYGLARIYQPVFAVMILYIARVGQAWFDKRAGRRAWIAVAISATVLVNASISLGPVTLNPLAGWAYNSFYHHADQPQLLHNMAIFGRRPLGFCDKSITVQNPEKKLTKAQKRRVRARSSR